MTSSKRQNSQNSRNAHNNKHKMKWKIHSSFHTVRCRTWTLWLIWKFSTIIMKILLLYCFTDVSDERREKKRKKFNLQSNWARNVEYNRAQNRIFCVYICMDEMKRAPKALNRNTVLQLYRTTNCINDTKCIIYLIFYIHKHSKRFNTLKLWLSIPKP